MRKLEAPDSLASHFSAAAGITSMPAKQVDAGLLTLSPPLSDRQTMGTRVFNSVVRAT